MNIKKLSVVGFGPGSFEGMTIKAVNTLDAADVIVGFKTYVEIIRKYFSDKEFIDTGMGGEVERVQIALAEADKGKKVALVCSGDAAVYGMAGLTYELSKEHQDVEIEIVPGVTAALSGSALLGAALGNDCCLISLSDYHTDKETIIKRIRMAAECDMCIALYNVRSKKRPDSLKEAVQSLLELLPENRVCGIARNIGREEEGSRIVTLKELENADVDMFTTVFIGNSSTTIISNKLVTRRGYSIG